MLTPRDITVSEVDNTASETVGHINVAHVLSYLVIVALSRFCLDLISIFCQRNICNNVICCQCRARYFDGLAF